MCPLHANPSYGFSYPSGILKKNYKITFAPVLFILSFINKSIYYFKYNTSKSYFSLAITCIALFFCSCQKENVDTTAVNSTASSTASLDASSSMKIKLHHGHGKETVTNYGAMICPPSTQLGSMSFQLGVADQLNISCIRGCTQVPGTWSVDDLLNSKYNVVLNFNTDHEEVPVPFVSDLKQYKKDLKDILSAYTIMPVVAVIENEESNRFYFSGTPEDYINQLSEAIDVMHSYGIKVANGGITNQGLNYLVYQDFLDQGEYDSAEDFRERNNVTPNAAATQERGAFINTLLKAYTKMDLDYVNFHWKNTSPDTQSLTQVIAYLKKVTGKPIISNELGQFDNDPNTLTSALQVCDDENFPYVLWYSPDENSGKKDVPLQHSDATLTPSGIAYQDFLGN